MSIELHFHSTSVNTNAFLKPANPDAKKLFGLSCFNSHPAGDPGLVTFTKKDLEILVDMGYDAFVRTEGCSIRSSVKITPNRNYNTKRI